MSNEAAKGRGYSPPLSALINNKQTHSGGFLNPRSQSETVRIGILNRSAIAACVNPAAFRACFTSSYVIDTYPLFVAVTIAITAIISAAILIISVAMSRIEFNTCILFVIVL